MASIEEIKQASINLARANDLVSALEEVKQLKQKLERHDANAYSRIGFYPEIDSEVVWLRASEMEEVVTSVAVKAHGELCRKEITIRRMIEELEL